MSEDCENEWIHARERCEEWFESPERRRELTGLNMDQCMCGQVSARCGGNGVL